METRPARKPEVPVAEGGPDVVRARRAEPVAPSGETALESPERGAGEPESSPVAAWEVLRAPHRESWWLRARRWAVLVALGVLVLTGAVTIAGTVRGWVARSVAPPPSAPVVAESEFEGAAVVFAADYLSWDQNERPARAIALNRVAAPGTMVEGWDGTGRQWADTCAAVGFARGSGDRAVVTVRVRVTPFAATSGASPAVSVRSDAGPSVASGPVLSSPGWTPEQARWLELAVPLAKRGGRVVVTAPPVLVGSPPAGAPGPALPGTSSAGDTTLAQGTQDTLTTLLRSYGTGELDYARATGTSFTGLDHAAALEGVTEWRVRSLDQGTDGSTRVGDATVTWALSGGAGKLTGSYRIELRNDSGRWYLSSVGAETEVVS
ncbi:MAG: hypothetical protein ACRDRS_24625 [Pseudonocardiaceae bacterium]